MTDDLFSFKYDQPKEATHHADAGERTAFLRRELNKHNDLYYNQAAPEISDAEYDQLYKELETLEREHPELDDPNSPTHRVGGTPLEGFKQIRHQVGMLSIDDIFENPHAETPDEELIDFYTRLCKNAGQNVRVSVEPKIDGVAVTLMYVDKALQYAATRGDGTVGDDVTANIRTIRSIPLTLPDTAPEMLEVRGEIFMPNAAFEALNESRDLEGLPVFANPRNATAGTLKLLDSKGVAKRPLAFLAHGIGAYEGPPLTSSDEFWALLHACRIPANSPVYNVDSLDDLRNAVKKIDAMRHTIHYGTDGAVVKVTDFALRETLGNTSRAPRWAAAYKFPPEQQETLLKDITIQVGRTGNLTPVAELEPVKLSGSVVARATLHNQDEIARKDIRIGDTVVVEKAGEIIPAVVKVITDKRPPDTEPYDLFSAVKGCCPACREPISKQDDKVAWKCTNFTCPAQAVSRIAYFCSRSALDIDSIGITVAEALVANNLAHSPLDLFGISTEQWGSLNLGTPEEPRRFGEKNGIKAMQALKDAATLPLERWLTAFGIPLVGEVIAKSLADTHPDLTSVAHSEYLAQLIRLEELGILAVEKNPSSRENKKRFKENPLLQAAAQQEFDAIIAEIHDIAAPLLERGYIREINRKQSQVPAYGSEIGTASARSIISFFSSHAGQHVLDELKRLGIHPASASYVENRNSLPQGILSGQSIAITGSLSKPRDFFEQLIIQHGGKPSSAISKNTAFLLAGEGGGSKRTKAASLNIPIISEEEFLTKINPSI